MDVEAVAHIIYIIDSQLIGFLWGSLIIDQLINID